MKDEDHQTLKEIMLLVAGAIVAFSLLTMTVELLENFGANASSETGESTIAFVVGAVAALVAWRFAGLVRDGALLAVVFAGGVFIGTLGVFGDLGAFVALVVGWSTYTYFASRLAVRVVSTGLAAFAALMLAAELTRSAVDAALTITLLVLTVPLFAWLLLEGRRARPLAAAGISVLSVLALLLALVEAPSGYFEWFVLAAAPLIAGGAIAYAVRGPVLVQRAEPEVA